MTDYYVNYPGGNNANAGLSWAQAKRDVRAAELLNPGPGDRIKIAKTDSPIREVTGLWAGTVNVGKMTGDTSLGCKLLIRSANTGVTLTGYNSATVSSSNFARGQAAPHGSSADNPQTNSWRTSFPSTTVANTKYSVCDLGVSMDLSTYEDITFWLYHPEANTRFGSTSWVIKLCSDAAGDTAVETITIDNLSNYASSSGSYGQWVTFRKGGALSSTVRSIALYSGASVVANSSPLDIATFMVYGANPTVMAGDWVYEQDYKECFQVSWIDNGDTSAPVLYFTVGGAPGTTISNGGCYNGWTNLVLKARRPVFLLAADMTQDYTTSLFPMEKGDTTGLSSNYLEYIGGWDTGSDTVTGVTFLAVMHGLNESLFYRNVASQGKTRQVLRNIWAAASGGLGQQVTANSNINPFDMYHTNCAWFNASANGGQGFYNGGSSGYPRLFRWDASESFFMGGTYYFSQTNIFNGNLTNCRFYRSNIGGDNTWGSKGTVTFDGCKFRRGTLLLKTYNSNSVFLDDPETTWEFKNGCEFIGSESTLQTGNYTNTVGRWRIHGALLMDGVGLNLQGRGICEATITEQRTMTGGTYSGSTCTGGYHWASKYGIELVNYTCTRTMTKPQSMTNMYLRNCSFPNLVNSGSIVGSWAAADLRLENCTLTNTVSDFSPSPVQFQNTFGKRIDIEGCTLTNFTLNSGQGGSLTCRNTSVTNTVIGSSQYIHPIIPGPKMVVADCTFAGELQTASIAYYSYGGSTNAGNGANLAPYVDFEDSCRIFRCSGLKWLSGIEQFVKDTMILTSDFWVYPGTEFARIVGNTGWKFQNLANSYRRAHDETHFKFPLARVAVKANHLITASVWVKRDSLLYIDYVCLWAEAKQLGAGQPLLRAESNPLLYGEWEQVTLTYTPTVDGVIEFCIGASFTYNATHFLFDDFTVTQA